MDVIFIKVWIFSPRPCSWQKFAWAHAYLCCTLDDHYACAFSFTLCLFVFIPSSVWRMWICMELKHACVYLCVCVWWKKGWLEGGWEKEELNKGEGNSDGVFGCLRLTFKCGRNMQREKRQKKSEREKGRERFITRWRNESGKTWGWIIFAYLQDAHTYARRRSDEHEYTGLRRGAAHAPRYLQL